MWLVTASPLPLWSSLFSCPAQRLVPLCVSADADGQEDVEVVHASSLAVREDGGHLVQPRAGCAAAPRGGPDPCVAP